MTYRIREMGQEDISVCAQILCSVYNNDLWQCRWSLERAAQYLLDITKMPGFVGFVLETDGRILGGIFAREKVWWNNSEISVEELFVLPEQQGRGLGSALLDKIVEVVAEKGLAGLTLTTKRYAPAAGFYRKHGFVDGDHVLFMYREHEEGMP